MMMRRILFAATILLAFAGMGTVSAQTKAETRLYNKTVAKPTVKSYNNFLKKYPESVYASQIRHDRDSLLFSELDKTDQKAVEDFLASEPVWPMYESASTLLGELKKSALSAEEATEIFRSFQAGSQDCKSAAIAYRDYGVDYIAAVTLPERSDGMLSFRIIGRTADAWKEVKSFEKPAITQYDGLTPAFFDGMPEYVDNFSNRYVKFTYVSASDKDSRQEYVVNLIDFEKETLFSAAFYGKSLLPRGTDTSAENYRIEGQSTAGLSSGSLVCGEERYLDALIAGNSNLVQIADADVKTDDAIQWWLQKNPVAESASRLSFGALDEDCGIVAVYKKHGKESSKTFNAALFDIRGYTVVCAYSKTHRQYLLVWCEPVARNKNTDKLLNSIYFENDNTLCLYYYHGRKTFKKRVNLANRTVR